MPSHILLGAVVSAPRLPAGPDRFPRSEKDRAPGVTRPLEPVAVVGVDPDHPAGQPPAGPGAEPDLRPDWGESPAAEDDKDHCQGSDNRRRGENKE